MAAAMIRRVYGDAPFRFDAPLPSTLDVGDGAVVLARGWIGVQAGTRILGFVVELDGERLWFEGVDSVRWDAPQYFGRPPAGFFLSIPIEGSRAGDAVSVTIIARTTAGEQLLAQTRIALHKKQPPTLDIKTPIAICLATYNPDLPLLRRQLDSIRGQSRADWTCLVHDDGSPPERFAAIVAACADDPRFIVRRSARNRGFYKNFEAALSLLPSTIPYVALCDQDDHWYPDKLEACVERLRARPQAYLVFCDMRLVDGRGREVAPTYWSQRHNNYTALDTLLFANTVTGAASVFRGALLEHALPFPPRHGSIFHDQWLAAVAMVSGGIEYIDRPLYDYTQHGENVVGHCDFGALSPLGAALRHARNLGQMLIRPRAIESNVWAMLACYQYEYRKLQVMAQTLSLRFPEAPLDVSATLALFDDRAINVVRLIERHWQVLQRGDTTDMAEFKLAAGLFLNKTISSLLVPMIGTKERLARVKKTLFAAVGRVPNRVYNTRLWEERAASLEAKLAPLRLEVSDDEPERVNILIPEINFRHLFGGYLGKFHLALRLAERGHRVRLLTVDYCPHDVGEWKAQIQNYPGIEQLLERVEVEAGWPRERTVRVSRKDSFVATTFWTAHIAQAALRSLDGRPFVYLIQEYEPFTFPMGSWHAVAHESYRFSHRAIFSTRQLRDYFRQQRIGVFAENPAGDDEHVWFENAIAKVAPDWREVTSRSVRRLLFYCRPQQHAARNMFELAVCALRRAVRDGVFGDASWTFEGIGADDGGAIELGRGHSLLLHERVSYAEYAKRLPQYDLGLSLMDTPHPSLVPLEMAAAGMAVVTSTCANKTAEELSAISTNLIGCAPTIEAVVGGLRRAVTVASDIDQRRAGAEVRWAGAWDEALGDGLLDVVDGWLHR